jgi:drug/metabolite transporter (DMT)-like permease
MGLGLNVGDLWSIAAAAASAMFILRLETASKAVRKSSELNAASLWIVSLLSFVWTLAITSKNIPVNTESFTTLEWASATVEHTVDSTLSTLTEHPLQMLYLSAVTTTLANYIQSKGQKDISAERASIIYAMDPVYGALVANLLLGEQLGIIGWVGSGLIFAAAATNAVFDFGPAE